MESVGSEFEEATQCTRRCRGPEGEFLHQRRLLRGDEFLKFGVEGGEVGVGGDGVERSVVALIALVFPDVDCRSKSTCLQSVNRTGEVLI